MKREKRRSSDTVLRKKTPLTQTNNYAKAKWHTKMPQKSHYNSMISMFKTVFISVTILAKNNGYHVLTGLVSSYFVVYK